MHSLLQTKTSACGLRFERNRDYVSQCDRDFVSDLDVLEISRIGDVHSLHAAVRTFDGHGLFVLVDSVDGYDQLRLRTGYRSGYQTRSRTDDTLRQRCSG